MIKFILAAMFVTQGVFAQQVELKIDGQRYYCSQDPNNNNNGMLSCENAAQKFSQSYKVCKETTSDYSYCHKNAYGKVKTELKSCVEVSEACYSACKETTSNLSYCHQTCY